MKRYDVLVVGILSEVSIIYLHWFDAVSCVKWPLAILHL